MTKINDKNDQDIVLPKKAESNYTKKAKGLFFSIRDHLRPSYRKQYNIRRIFGCLMLYLVLYMALSESTLPSKLLLHIWCIIAFVFWHYAFWSYQGGIIDNFTRRIFYYGSLWSVIGKVLLQYVLILMWIPLIAPISGIFTWRKAVKHNEELFIEKNPKGSM